MANSFITKQSHINCIFDNFILEQTESGKDVQITFLYNKEHTTISLNYLLLMYDRFMDSKILFIHDEVNIPFLKSIKREVQQTVKRVTDKHMAIKYPDKIFLYQEDRNQYKEALNNEKKFIVIKIPYRLYKEPNQLKL